MALPLAISEHSATVRGMEHGNPSERSTMSSIATLRAAREEFEAARTPAVLAGLEMVRKGLGSMAALPPLAPGLGGQPCKIAQLVAWAHYSGSHYVQAQFDRYIEACDNLTTANTIARSSRREIEEFPQGRRSTFDEQLDSFGERQASAGYEKDEDDVMPCGCCSGSCYCE